MRANSNVRRLIAVISFLLGVLLFVRCAQASPPGTGWGLLYADEFGGNSVDTQKWITQYLWGSPTHNHDAYMLPQNLSVANGILTETGKRETAPDGKAFTSGVISTGYDILMYTYGYAEARIKLPTRPGSWPAFWGLYYSWPPESDIMEFPVLAGETYQDYYISYHYTDSGGNPAAYGGWRFPIVLATGL